MSTGGKAVVRQGELDDGHSTQQTKATSFVDTYRTGKIALFRLVILLGTNDTEEEDRRMSRRVIKARSMTAALLMWRLLQLLSFPFSATFAYAWNEGVTQWWINTLELTRFDSLIIGKKLTDRVDAITVLVVIALVLTVLGGLAYVAYLLEMKQRDATMGFSSLMARPLYLPMLNVGVRMITGPLYIPIMGVLLTTLRCKETSTHVCWEGADIGLAAAGVLVAVVVCFAALVVKGTLIRNDGSSRHAEAMSHGRSEMALVLLQTLLVFTYSVASSQSSTTLWVLTLLTLVCACAMLYFHWNMHAYYNVWTDMTITCTLAVFVWAGISLLVTQMFNDDDQTGGTVFFFIGGIVVAILARLMLLKKVEAILSKDVSELKSIYDVDMMVRNKFEKAIDVQQAEDIADGNEENRALMEQELAHNGGSNFGSSAGDLERNGMEATRHEMREAFEKAVHKFSHLPFIYIFEAYMHALYFNNDHVANNCLQACEDANPPLDAQFFIYKTRYQMECKIRTDPDGLSMLKYISATEHFNKAQELMRNAAFLKYQFWNELAEEYPNVERLNKLGGDVNTTVSEAHTHFQEVMSVNRDSPSVMRAYGKFLTAFLNDAAAGQAMIDRAEERQAKNQESAKKFDSSNLGNGASLFDEQTAIITISGDRASIGSIVSVNEAAMRMFGRARGEMVDNNVNMIMPPPFSDLHDGFLKAHQQTGKGMVINTTRKLYGIHKTGYIFPMYLHVKQVSGGLSKALYIGVMRQVVTAETDHSAIINADTQQVIRCTAGWSRFFGVTLHDVTVGGVNIVDAFADWESVEEHKHHTSADDCYRNHAGRLVKHTTASGTHTLLVTVHRLQFRTCAVDVVRVVEKVRQLEPLSVGADATTAQAAAYRSKSPAHGGGRTKDVLNITGDGGDASSRGIGASDDEDNDGVDVDDNDDGLSMDGRPENDDEDEDGGGNDMDERKGGLLPFEAHPSPRRGSPRAADINIRMQHRNDNDDDDEDEAAAAAYRRQQAAKKKKKKRSVRYRDEEESQGQRSHRSRKSAKSASSSTGTRNDWRTGLQRIRALFLNQSDSLEPAMKKLRFTLMIVIMGIMFMAVLVTALVVASMQTYNDNVGILNRAGGRRSHLVTAAQSVRSLDLIRQGVLPNTREAWYRARLDKSAAALWSVQTELFFASEVSGDHQKLYEVPSITVNEVVGNTTGTEDVNLIEGLNEFQSAARILVTSPLASIHTEDAHVFYVRSNLDTLVASVNVSCNFYEKNTVEEADKITLLQTILLTVTLTSMMVLVAVLIGPAISRVEATRKEIFGMFISDISLPMLKKIKEGAFEMLSEEDKLLEGDQAEDSNCIAEKKLQQEKFEAQRQQLEEQMLMHKLQGYKNTSSGSPRGAGSPRQLASLLERDEVQMAQFGAGSSGLTGDHHTVDANGHPLKVEKTRRRADAFRFSNQQKYRLFCHIAIVVMVATCYFLGTFFWEREVLSSSVERVPEMNNAGRMRTIARRAIFRAREAVVEPVTHSDFYSRSQAVRAAHAYDDLGFLVQLLHGLLYGSKQMSLVGSVSRSGPHVDLLFKDVCPVLTQQGSTACATFHGGVMTHGGAAALLEYRAMLNEITQKALEDGSGITMAAVQAKLTAADWVDLEQMDEVYLMEVLEKVAAAYSDQETQAVSDFLVNRELVLSMFIVMLLFMYFVLYAPLVRRLDVSLKRTRGMLLMIPSEYMMSIPALATILTDAAITAKL